MGYYFASPFHSRLLTLTLSAFRLTRKKPPFTLEDSLYLWRTEVRESRFHHVFHAQFGKKVSHGICCFLVGRERAMPSDCGRGEGKAG